MEQAIGKSGRGLQRMAEGVAEIEQRALAGLALVAGDDRGLGAAGGRDRVLARRAAGEDVGVVGLQPGEKGFVAEHAIFGDFGVAGAELARRQRVEHRGIGDHQHRLMERAEQVLALRRVDAGLAADGGIDLRQQRGRHLHEIDAAAQDRRRKAGEIADHAAAERNHQIVALDLGRDQRLGDLFEAGIGLRPLAFLDDDSRGRNAGLGQRRSVGFQPVLCHGAVGDDGGAHAGPQRGDARAQRLQHVAADDDVIGAIAERDVDGDIGRNVSVAQSWRNAYPDRLSAGRTARRRRAGRAAHRYIHRRSGRAARRASRSSYRRSDRPARALRAGG